MFFVTDSPPIAVAYAPFTIGHMGDFMWFDGSNSSDDLGIVSYLWEFGDGATDANIITSHQYSSRRTFTVNLTVWDILDQNDTDSLTIDIQNRPPIADAGADQNAFKRSLVTLDGSGSYDPDGDALIFLWGQGAGPSATLDCTDPARPTFTPALTGTYLFYLNVSDMWAWSGDEVNIVVVNRPPIADAGPDRVVAKKTTVTLDGAGSSDPDRDTLTFSWTQLSGPSIMLSDANTATPSFIPPTRGSYLFQLEVDDGDGGNSTDTIQVTATNADPIADAGPDISMRKTLTVTLDGGGSSDPDSDILAFVWTQLSGFAVSLTNAGSAVASFTAARVGSYTFMLDVNDGDGGTDSDTVTVDVWGLPPIAVITANPPRTFTGISIRFDGASSHDPDGVIVNYSFDFDDGAVMEGTAVFRDHTYAVAGTYNVTLSVRDDDGNTSVAWAVVVVDPPTKEPNWKPLVALLFSITLGLLGMWSSRKHPWKGIATREAALKTWCCTALPFAVAESVTGILSLLTGQLGIPPVMGLGTVVDVMILGIGTGLLVVHAYTGRKDEDAAQWI
jgi:PKD repeat protein